MARFKPYKVNQMMLLPPSIHNFLPEGHLAKVISRVVEQLDTTAIEDKYSELGQMCKELGIIKVGQINIDGTKIKANAADRRTKTKEEYRKWAKKIDDKIKKILEEADEADKKEDKLYGDKRGDELPEDINTEEKLKAKIE